MWERAMSVLSLSKRPAIKGFAGSIRKGSHCRQLVTSQRLDKAVTAVVARG
jgi:hypothetical protein